MSALRLCLPLALIGVCLWFADGGETLQRLFDLAPGWGLATLGLLNAVTLLSALRWQRTAKALGLELPRCEAVREYYMAQFVNQTLPGGVLGDAARAARSRRNQLNKSLNTSFVVVTHDLELADKLGKIAYLDDGKLSIKESSHVA